MDKYSRQLELDVFRAEAELYLTDEGQTIMRAIRKYGKGNRNMLQYIYKQIKKREDYIADLELELLERQYLSNKLIGKVVRLGDYGIPVKGRTMETLIKIVDDERVYNKGKRH